MSSDRGLVRTIGPGRLEIARGDLTRETVAAIVNAANSSLLGGGGVDGAIHRAGGPAILDECRAIRARQGPLPPGEAVITTGGALPARRVIHTVGPVWQGGGAGEAETLAACYRSSLALADAEGLESVAFPSISTGAFGYPIDEAAPVALRTIARVLRGRAAVRLVRCVLFSERDLDDVRARPGRDRPRRGLAGHLPDLALEGGQPVLEVAVLLHDDLDLAVRHPAHAPGMARAERDHELLAMDAEPVRDLEDALDLAQGDRLEHAALLLGRSSVQ